MKGKRGPAGHGRRGPDRSGRTGHGRHNPPPDDTGFERRFFEELERGGDAIVVTLRDGSTLVGSVVESDRGQFVLRTAEGVDRAVRTRDVRHVRLADRS